MNSDSDFEQDWDMNPWMLDVANGCIDLRTADFQPLEQPPFVGASPTEWQGLETPAPRWEQFIREIFDNEELTAFVQRLLGYGITGLSDEHIVAVLYGTGRNGKSTLLETLAYVLGDELMCSIPASEWLSRSVDSVRRPRPYLMQLRYKRLVWAEMGHHGCVLDADTIRLLSSGDLITVRLPYQSPVTFRPMYLPLLVTNTLPVVSAEPGLERRVRVVEFPRSFKVGSPGLLMQLQAEASGILAWLVRGCLDWQRDGLYPCPF